MLRHLLTILIVFNFFQIYSQDINWLTLDKAIELQKKNPKNIIIDVYTNWCGPCKLLDKKLLKIKMYQHTLISIIMLLNLMLKEIQR